MSFYSDPKYRYDALNRLDTAVGGFGSQDFAYDKNGNRTTLDDNGSVVSYSYATGSNRLTQAANDSVVLDANGNTQSHGTWTYTHNVNNRLVAANDNGTLVASYAYNALGQRVSKTVGSVTTQFVYGLNGELLAELDGSGGVLREYVYLNGAPLAVIDGSTIHTIHTDHLGTPRAVSDSAGTRVWEWVSDPFGRSAANDDVDGDGSVFTLNLHFPGQYYDAETGLHYNYFRDYDPSTGRYVQSDPIGLAGGLNTYGYVLANPIRWKDPRGLELPIGIVGDSDPDNATLGEVGVATLITVAPIAIFLAPEALPVLARFTPLAAATASKTCSTVAKNKDKIKETCKNGALAAVLGISMCQKAEGKVPNSPRRFAQHRESLTKDVQPLKPPRRDTGVIPDK